MKNNLTVVISDSHWGHENTLYGTYWYTLEKLIKEICNLNVSRDWKNVFLIVNGDMVSGTLIYHNQFLQNHLNKNEDIILFGSYLLHRTIKLLEIATGKKVKTYIVVGNHEGSKRPLAHNFILSISRRLNSYGHYVRYASNYLILDIARDLTDEEYNVCAFHGYGGADYSSASPSLVRELTRTHSQLSSDQGIIIKRFTIGHTHWLEPGRSVLGIRFDVTGGFQRWEQKMSYRECGLLYYLYDETGDFDVRGVSGLNYQIKEAKAQNMHYRNMRYVADILLKAIDYEINIGLLRKEDFEEKK